VASGLKEPVHLYFVRLRVSEPDDMAVLAEELRARGARVESYDHSTQTVSVTPRDRESAGASE